MIKDTYEISLWEDYISNNNGETSVGYGTPNSVSDPATDVAKPTVKPKHFEERKIAVIGSDTLTASCRALEPQLIENINGTHTFTFKMLYVCRYDTIEDLREQFLTSNGDPFVTSDNLNFILSSINFDNGTYQNPFLNLLVNERKVKVKWKDKWYDFVIKDCQEDSSGKSITYTCKDLFINELSRTGFEVELDTELQNNQGTVTELAKKVLESTDWIVDEEGSDLIQQEIEEPVYEVTLLNNIVAHNDTTNTDDISILANKKILVYYNQIQNIFSNTTTSGTIPYFQFAYADQYETENNSQLVLNADCYSMNVRWLLTSAANSSYIELFITNLSGSVKIGEIYYLSGVSANYRAKRLVRSQKTVFDPLTDRLCKVYKYVSENPLLEAGFTPSRSAGNGYGGIDIGDGSIDSDLQQIWGGTSVEGELDPSVILAREGDEIYGYQEIQYRDPTIINNLIINSKDFTSTTGWVGNDLRFQLYPSFDSITFNEEDYVYTGKSYLKMPTDGIVFNEALRQSSNFIPNGFSAGEKYIFRYKAVKDNLVNNIPVEYYTQSNVPLIPVICRYEIDFNIVPASGHYFTFTRIDNENQENNWIEWEATCQKSISPADIYSDRIGLFFVPVDGRPCWLEEAQFYLCCYGEDGNRIDPGAMDASSVASVVYTYYNHTKYPNTYLSSGKPRNLWQSTEDWGLIGTSVEPIYEEGFPKIRSINVKRSNCFNILQTLAETFQCWVEFEIKHDADGRISYYGGNGDPGFSFYNLGKIIEGEEDGEPVTYTIKFDKDNYKYGAPKKFVRFKKNIGQETGVGFIYGIDLKTIQRTIESDQIVTKTIVIPNTNEFAEDGFCTIARSLENYPRTNFILNFDYYITHGLLSRAELNKDLYLSSDAIGYYYHLHQWNLGYDGITKKLTAKRAELLRQEGYLKVYNAGLTATQSRIQDVKNELIALAGADTWDNARPYIKAHEQDEPVATRLAQLATLAVTLGSYQNAVTNLEMAVEALDELIKNDEKEQQYYIDKINAIHYIFYKKYSRFLQEGTWTSNDYIDDNLYYLDGESVAYTSSRPKVSYNISVLRLSSLEEFRNKIFHLGDIGFVQDTEFFGYVYVNEGNRSVKTPYKEKVLISEVTSNFDEPDKDTFKVQNYKTQFEDLFHRITSTTQSLQYASGEYARAAGAIQSNGTINIDILQASIEQNEQLVYSAQNECVIQDSTGITVTDLTQPNNKTKITSGGVFITTDGGLTWKQAINGVGVTTQYLTSGIIKTNIINVMDGNHSAFRWDDKGITAYTPITTVSNDVVQVTGMNEHQFVRFDRFGVYGVRSSDETNSTFNPGSTQDIENAADFGVVWDKFFMKARHGNSGEHMVKISSDEDIQVLTTTGDSQIERIKIGHLGDESNSDYYGIRISDATGSAVMETGSEGNLWLRKKLNVTTTSSHNVTIGMTGNSDPVHGAQVFNANGQFIIYEDGHIEAHSGSFGGNSFSDDEEISSEGNVFIGGGQIIITMPDNNEDPVPFWIRNLNGESLLVVDEDGLTLNGTINALSGTIGGFRIENNRLVSTEGEDLIELNGGNGWIRAGAIEIGNAVVTNQIKLGAEGNIVLTSPSVSGTIFRISNAFKDYISITSDGKLIVGDITLDGVNSIISDISNNFVITPNISTFNNVNITGKLSTVVFEANHVQAAGGAMIFKPSYKVESMVGTTIILEKDALKVDISDSSVTADLKDHYVYIIGESGSRIGIGKVSGTDSQDGNDVIYLRRPPILSSNERPVSVIDIGKKGDYVISVNSNQGGIDYLKPYGISLSEVNEASDDELGSGELKVFIGNLDTLGRGLEGHGLFGENVYLTGSLITKVGGGEGDDYGYAGVNTLNSYSATQFGNEDVSPIVFWAGAGGLEGIDIQNAAFQVTQNGSLYASRAKFTNSVIVGSSITGAEIHAAKIYGIGEDQYGLEFHNTEKGIAFYDDSSNSVTDVIFSINKDGLLAGSNYFIKIEPDTRNAKVDAKFNSLQILNNSIPSLSFENNEIVGIENIEIKINDNSNLLIEPNEVQVCSRSFTIGKMSYERTNKGWNLYIKD